MSSPETPTMMTTPSLPTPPMSPQPPPLELHIGDGGSDVEQLSYTVTDAYYRIALQQGVIINTVFPTALKTYITRSEWEHITIAFSNTGFQFPARCCCCTDCYRNHGCCFDYACLDCLYDYFCDCCNCRQGCIGMIRESCCQKNPCCCEPCLFTALYTSACVGCCYSAQYYESLIVRRRLKALARQLNTMLFLDEPVLRVFTVDYLTVDMKVLLLVYAKKSGLADEEELDNAPGSMLSIKSWISKKRKKRTSTTS